MAATTTADPRREQAAPPVGPAAAPRLSIGEAAALDAQAVIRRLGSSPSGLSSAEAAARLRADGPNALRTHHAQPLDVLLRQLRSPLLALLLVAATVSFFVGERTDALVIGVILAASVGMGFVNEYRAERAAEALHTQVRHETAVLRDGRWSRVDVVALVAGDVVRISIGEVVPADLRLTEAVALECDESVLTGESLPVEKSPAPTPPHAALAELSSCALMGTVVRGGEGRGVVVGTGARAEFGRIAVDLGTRQPETEFQVGLRRFSGFLVRVATVLTTAIFVVNLVLRRPLIDALLFSLAIAVGITPQLLPAVVTTSLATGAHRLARARVLVKRLVVIEDLGDIDVLVTDKTGTLTEGTITLETAVDASGDPSDVALRLGLLCNEAMVDEGVAVSGNPLDVALWTAPRPRAADISGYTRVALAPFDHERRLSSVLVDAPGSGRLLVTKGAPEAVLSRCTDTPAAASGFLDAALERGSRVVAIATRDAAGCAALSPDDEHDLRLAGFLVFLDPPKASAAASVARLQELGITVKIATGDNARVAEKVCGDIGLRSLGTLTGDEVDELADEHLAERVRTCTIFARVSPEQKARIIRTERAAGSNVAFLGDGVNDAVALHDADVGISVDTATDVAKDAADIILLEKDLDVLAAGVMEGRRTFANTVKYVLMGTSSNFGNMFSAAAASAFLKFLPMLPSQILLNNLLYDASQMAIPTDTVDPEISRKPSHWDIAFIRRFMLFFGPMSSLFDFLTFAVMLNLFNAGERLFQAGWFVESLATQTLIIFVIRTRRTPFWRSRPSIQLTVAAVAVVAIGAALPISPLASPLGFDALPPAFYAVLAGMVCSYLALVETAKRWFTAAEERPAPRRPEAQRRTHRRAARWSHAGPLG